MIILPSFNPNEIARLKKLIRENSLTVCEEVSIEKSKKQGAAPKAAFAVVGRFDVYISSPHVDAAAFVVATVGGYGWYLQLIWGFYRSMQEI